MSAVGGGGRAAAPPSLPPHGSPGAEGSETLGVDRNLLSVFCCLLWGGRAGPGQAQELRTHRGTWAALALGSVLPTPRNAAGLRRPCRDVDFPQAKRFWCVWH